MDDDGEKFTSLGLQFKQKRQFDELKRIFDEVNGCKSKDHEFQQVLIDSYGKKLKEATGKVV